MAGAIIASPGLATAKPVPAAKVAVAKIMARVAPSFTLANDLDVEGISRDEVVVKKYKEDPLVHGMISARLGLDFMEAGPRIIAHAAEISIPVLLAQGTADRLVDVATTLRFASAADKRVTYKPFEGWYHELHNEPGKEEWFRVMLEWISSHS